MFCVCIACSMTEKMPNDLTSAESNFLGTVGVYIHAKVDAGYTVCWCYQS